MILDEFFAACCGGKYPWGALAALARLKAEKYFLPRTRRDKKWIVFCFAATRSKIL